MLRRAAPIHLCLQKIIQQQELSENVMLNLDPLYNALMETRCVLDYAHSNLAEGNGMLNCGELSVQNAETDIGDFWLSFLEMTDPLPQNINAWHARRLTDYIQSTYDMLPRLVAYNNHEYGQGLPGYWAMLSLLSVGQIDFFSDHITQWITGPPNTYQPLDLWI